MRRAGSWAGARTVAGARKITLSEGAVLKGLFVILLVGVVAIVGFDLRALAAEAERSPAAAARAVGGELFDPPARTDGVRDFAPFSGVRPEPSLPGVVELTEASLEDPIVFTRGPEGAASAVGFINPGAAEAFDAFLEAQNGEVRALHLHSPGGSVLDALTIARRIRADDIDTVVSDGAYCASSCPIILTGGVRRTVSLGATVGVHQVFSSDEEAGDLADGIFRAQTVTGEIQTHLIAMGVRPSLWIRAMETPPESLYALNREELLAYRLATEFGD